jgi:tetratricopeptide (TPR) repeat protein/mono/diheme cytochrome c family protein
VRRAFAIAVYVASTCVAASPVLAADTPTFSRDIAPIIFARCASCHRPGEIGPFSLLTYRDVRQHATQIVEATGRRVMPPWKPRPGAGPFAGDRSLSDAEIARIRDWATGGMPEGNRRDLPPAPESASGWQLGTPDLVVTMEATYTLRADGEDVFRTFVLPIPTDRVQFIRGMEFHPGNARAVHHANVGVDRTHSSRRLDDADSEPGYVGGMVQDANYPPGYMLGWTPGQRPRPSPEGMAWRLEPGSDLVAQLHLQPTGKPEPVQVSVGFFFTSDAPTRTPIGLRLGSETIEIPPGKADYTIADQYVLPVDVQLLGLQPHAHNLARRMDAKATKPDGSVVPLIQIDDWDFRWQDVYVYQQPIVLPKGTTVSMRFTYDNSAANPRNPFQPPRLIVWGQNTSDEMGDLWLQVVPVAQADVPVLSGDIERKTRAEDLAAYTRVLRADPNNPLRHDAVAMLHLQAGRLPTAIAEFRESLRLNPDSVPTHYNLGLALAAMRQYPAARAEFETAVRLDPNHADAHNNLGAMLHAFGELDAAAEHYRRAFELRPENAEAHNNLGRLLMSQRNDAGAIEEFTRALALSPAMYSALSGLAWVRATTPDPGLRQPDEAIRLAEMAAQISGRRDPTVLDSVAAAYAAAGQFERAEQTAEEAMKAADALGMATLWVEIRQRLQKYQAHQPYLAK